MFWYPFLSILYKIFEALFVTQNERVGIFNKTTFFYILFFVISDCPLISDARVCTNVAYAGSCGYYGEIRPRFLNCMEFCENYGMQCVRMYDDTADTCQHKRVLNCDYDYIDTLDEDNDYICECGNEYSFFYHADGSIEVSTISKILFFLQFVLM